MTSLPDLIHSPYRPASPILRVVPAPVAAPPLQRRLHLSLYDIGFTHADARVLGTAIATTEAGCAERAVRILEGLAGPAETARLADRRRFAPPVEQLSLFDATPL